MSMLKDFGRFFHINKWAVTRYFSSVNPQLTTKYSYLSTPSPEPLLGVTIGDYFNFTSTKHSQEIAIKVRHQNISKTFLELKEDVDKMARSLIASGHQQGDRIGIMSTNCYEWIVVQYAAFKTGVIIVGINPAFQSEELTICLQKTGMSTLITAEHFKNVPYHKLLCSAIPSLKDSKIGELKDSKFPLLKKVVMISKNQFNGIFKYDDLFDMGVNNHQKQLEARENSIQCHDPALIYFTSGTTGNPKGATLTHHNIVNTCYFTGKRWGFHKDEHKHNMCVLMPLFHVLAGVGCCMISHMFGICTVYPSAVYNLKEVFKTIHEEKSSVLVLVPTIYFDIINSSDFKDYDLTSLKTGIVGGNSVSKELFHTINQKIPSMKLINAYGMTETSPTIITNDVSDPYEIRLNSVGSPLEHQEVKLMDENERIVNHGTVGEIWTRGFHVMDGYWEDDEKTKETITPSGWLKTGDLGVICDNGDTRIVGRKKDLIIRGGENIHPVEVEQYIETHSKVAIAQIIGVPDDRMGEELCACILPESGEKLTEEDIRQHCKDKIAYYKIPRYIEFIDAFPYTLTGKIKRGQLRTDTIAKLKNKNVLEK